MEEFMRITLASFLLILTLALFGCSASRETRVGNQTAPSAPSSDNAKLAKELPADGTTRAAGDGDNPAPPLSAADSSQTNAAAAERKIIKNATLMLEVPQAEAAQQRITAIAEAKGGFVVSTDAQRQTAEGQDPNLLTITVVARVPSNQFEATLTDIRGTGTRVTQEKQTGQDVTEDMIDLDARMRAQQALETQFLEIMKQARTVQDALQVQRELANVRGEIERIQGRLRFLQNQTALSTITVTLIGATPLLGSPTGFGASLREAFSGGLWVAVAILSFLVRAAVAVAPTVLLIFLPIGLVVWCFHRLWRRNTDARRLSREEMDRMTRSEPHDGA
jgi:hypothetical protein